MQLVLSTQIDHGVQSSGAMVPDFSVSMAPGFQAFLQIK